MQDVVPRRSWVDRLSAQNTGLWFSVVLGVVITLVYLILFMARNGSPPGGFELTTTVNNLVPLAFASLGQSFAVLTGGLDLSVGGMMDVTNSIAAGEMSGGAGSIVGWTAVILLLGAGVGLVNGLLVAFGRLQPILVTLGMLAILQGLALKVLPQPGGTVPPGVTRVLANPSGPDSLIILAVGCLIWYAVRRTRFGVNVYAIGNDRRAARMRGVPVRRTIVLTYATSGLFSAVAGLLLAANTTGGDPASGDVFTLTSIAAVVIGGLSLFGGRGSGIGAVIGAFVVTLLTSVLFFASIDPLFEPFFQGVFLVLAAALTAFIGYWARQRRMARRTP